jgi:hypothetical protein
MSPELLAIFAAVGSCVAALGALFAALATYRSASLQWKATDVTSSLLFFSSIEKMILQLEETHDGEIDLKLRHLTIWAAHSETFANLLHRGSLPPATANAVRATIIGYLKLINDDDTFREASMAVVDKESFPELVRMIRENEDELPWLYKSFTS